MARATFPEVADHFDRMATAVRSAPMIAARRTAPVIAAAIHEEFGKAPPLVDLAESTQIERVTLGYSANEPLKRTGTLEESYVPVAMSGFDLIEHGVHGSAIAAAGSADERAAWMENGYINARSCRPVPPRPAARLGFIASQPMARTIWKYIVGRAVGTRS